MEEFTLLENSETQVGVMPTASAFRVIIMHSDHSRSDFTSQIRVSNIFLRRMLHDQSETPCALIYGTSRRTMIRRGKSSFRWLGRHDQLC